MAFEQGTATDIDDLIAKISTFLTANGWTEDRRDNINGIVGWSKNSIFVSGRWDPADPIMMSWHQATAILPASGTEPGDVTGDSGHGFNTSTSHTNGNLASERHMELGPGPYTSYYIFENDATPAYAHIVVETSTDIFVHFGMGELDKVGDGWTGGEYCYGHHHPSGTEMGTLSSFMLDGYHSNSTQTAHMRQTATMRITGFTGQIAGSIWGKVWGHRGSSVQNLDTAGNARVPIQGGFRGGPFSTPWGLYSADKSSGLIPMYSIGCFYVDTTLNHTYFLGWQSDVRGVNLRGIAAKDEFVVGSDTWIFFPAMQRDIGGGARTTSYMGIAYKKVTA